MSVSFAPRAASRLCNSARASLSSSRIAGSIRTQAPRTSHRSFSVCATRKADNGTATGDRTRQTTASPRAPASATGAPAEDTHDLTVNPTPLQSLTETLSEPPPELNEDERQVDWTRSFHGLSAQAFSPEQIEVLTAPLSSDDIEIKPDGIVYLPEIKYRRILNKAFGPGGWGLAPRGETIVTGKLVTREYALVAGGRLVSIARGEMTYFDPEGIPTATEGCKSNALMRCCKDLGIASELWDPRFIKKFLAEKGRELIVEHQTTKKRRKHWMRADDELKWPLQEVAPQVTRESAGARQFTPRPAATNRNGNGNGNGAAPKS